MPQIYNMPSRIPEGNYAEAELLNRGLAQNVADVRKLIARRNLIASNIRKAVQLNPDMFGKGGFKVDRYGNYEMAIRQPDTEDESVLMGPDKQTVETTELQDAQTELNKVLANKQETRNRIEGILGTNGSGSGQGSSIGVGTVLAPSNNTNSGQSNLPSILQINNNLTQPNVGKQGTGQSTSITNSKTQSRSLDLRDNGGSGQGVLATDTTLENNVNAIDPVKIEDKDLRTLASLEIPEMGGNQTFTKLLQTDMEFKKDLNEQMKDYGTKTNRILTTTTATDGGMSAGLNNSLTESSTVSKSQNYAPQSGGYNPNKKPGVIDILVPGITGSKSIATDADGTLQGGVNNILLSTHKNIINGGNLLHSTERGFTKQMGWEVTHTGSSSAPGQITISNPKTGAMMILTYDQVTKGWNAAANDQTNRNDFITLLQMAGIKALIR